MKQYTFEKLISWQHARKLAVWIYKITTCFPGEERFGLISLMRRGVISIASILAEGISRKTAKDQSHFSTISYSSTIELLNDLIISKDLSYLLEEQYNEGKSLIEYQTLLIANLQKAQSSKMPGYNPKPSQQSKLS